MEGFLTDFIRDMIAIFGVIASIVSIYYAFKSPSPFNTNRSLRRDESTFIETVPSAFYHFRSAWRNDFYMKDAIKAGLLIWIVACLLVIFLPTIGNTAFACIFMFKNIPLLYAVFEFESYLKKNSTKEIVFKTRAIVLAATSTILLSVFFISDSWEMGQSKMLDIYLYDLVGLMSMVVFGVFGWLYGAIFKPK